MNSAADIERIIRESHTIAIVGLSDNPGRHSHQVAQYLQRHGYRVIPVNPTVAEVLGQKCYPDLLSIPEQVDVVDIFRRSEHVPPVVEEAIQIGAKAIWMQLGVVHEGAAAKARAAGLMVVMDRCMKIEHERLIREGITTKKR
ncbi:MAG: CoA-binding protein [Chloroflexi bacterium]|nr:CoA-binding protein [Chloroflexota bacterium]